MDINHISAHPLWPFFLSVFNIWLPQIWGNSSLLHYSPQHSQGLTLSFVWNQVWTAEKDWIVPFSMPCPVYSFEYQNILTFLFYLVIFFSEVTAVRQSEKQQDKWSWCDDPSRLGTDESTAHVRALRNGRAGEYRVAGWPGGEYS